MDLSQQELPLTAFFTRDSKESRSRIAARKKDKPSEEDSQSVVRSSKRKRNDVPCSPASPLSSSTGQSKLRPTTLQLPTPAASARKRMRGEHLEELPGKSQLTSTGAVLSSVVHNPIRSGDKDLTQLEFGPTPLNFPPSRKGAEDAISELPSTSLATPSTDRRKTTKPIDTDPRLSNHIVETGIATPRTPSRRVPKPRHCIDHSPLAQSNRPLPVFVPPSKTTDAQPSDGHVIPMLPIPSSQSQYLLHLDATPKRKQRSQRIEHVISSQTQEESELTLSSSLKPLVMASLSIGHSPGQ